jgi:ribonuclease BN (tRNA processing enzyme)
MSKVRVRFLGSGDAFGSGGRFQTCIHVTSDEATFLIDCGASTLIAMRRFSVAPNDVQFILISHFHGDHFGGLPFFLLDAQFVSRRTSPLAIAGPPGIEARTREIMEVMFPGSSQTRQAFPIEFVDLEEGRENVVGRVAVTPYRVAHGSGFIPYGLRVRSAGKVIAYSGDTEWTETLVQVADGADLFICESYVFEKKVKSHLDYRTLMSHRARLGCRRLILTHLSADVLDRLDEVEAEYAEDGKLIEI